MNNHDACPIGSSADDYHLRMSTVLTRNKTYSTISIFQICFLFPLQQTLKYLLQFQFKITKFDAKIQIPRSI